LAGTFSGEQALRLSKKRKAVLNISTENYSDVVIHASVASNNLQKRGKCLIHISLDNGVTWLNQIRIKEKNNSKNWNNISISLAGIDNNPNLSIRLKSKAKTTSEHCWFGAINIEGATLTVQ